MQQFVRRFASDLKGSQTYAVGLRHIKIFIIYVHDCTCSSTPKFYLKYGRSLPARSVHKMVSFFCSYFGSYDMVVGVVACFDTFFPFLGEFGRNFMFSSVLYSQNRRARVAIFRELKFDL